MSRVCQRCGVTDISKRHFHARFCFPCTEIPHQAHLQVARAVARGDLPPARLLTCTDCGKPAAGYDHRDYGRPLDVEPVCRSCNWKRGPAACPMPEAA